MEYGFFPSVLKEVPQQLKLSLDLKYTQPSLNAMENVRWPCPIIMKITLFVYNYYLYLVHHQGEEVHPCSSNCTCLQQILVDIPQTAEHFARIKDPPENIAVALFQCVESMQHFSYGGTIKHMHEATLCPIPTYTLAHTRMYLHTIS